MNLTKTVKMKTNIVYEGKRVLLVCVDLDFMGGFNSIRLHPFDV